MVFEAIGTYSAIGKIAMKEVQIALDAGWQVSVIAKLLDESLHDRVEWIKLYCPPRGFILQWSTARFFIQRALGERRFDVVHAHQPQVADLSDVFQCHYLTRVAHEARCLRSGHGFRAGLNELQQLGAMYQEDLFYSRWNPDTRMLYNSPLTGSAFERLYGAPARNDVLLCPIEAYAPPPDEEKQRCRQKLIGDADRNTVLGYLGGLQVRKGYRELLDALRHAPNVTCLFGGSDTAGFREPGLDARLHAVGQVDDLDTFYNACDVFIAPSLFEPFGLVVNEAASRGVPVIATETVGALPILLEYGAGERWQAGQPLGPLVEEMNKHRERYRQGIQRMCDDNGHARFRDKLLGVYGSVLQEKRGQRVA